MFKFSKSHIKKKVKVTGEIHFDDIFHFTQVSKISFQHVINTNIFINEVVMLLFILSSIFSCAFYMSVR